MENTFHVSRGQALVDLDPRDYQVAVENAAANLAEAKQSVLAARQDYELSLANLNAAVATNVKAQEDVKRYRELLDQGVIARETDDAVVRDGKIAAASVNSDRAAVAAAAKLIGEAQAAADAAQATLDQAKLNLSYTHIVTPASGVVGDKTVEVGERVQPGEQLLTVVPLRGASRKREEAYNDDKGTNHFLQHVWTRLSVSRSGSPGCERSDRGRRQPFSRLPSLFPTISSSRAAQRRRARHSPTFRWRGWISFPMLTRSSSARPRASATCAPRCAIFSINAVGIGCAAL